MNFHLTRLAPVLLIIRITGNNGHSLRVSFFVPPQKKSFRRSGMDLWNFNKTISIRNY